MQVEKLLKVILPALILVAVARGQPADSPKVTMAVSLAKSVYIIGEPMTATLAIENHSDAPFLHHSMDPYDIAVTDEAGRSVYSPHSEILAYGGWFTETRINPGERKEFKINFNDYCAARKTGVYTVRLKIRQEDNRGMAYAQQKDYTAALKDFNAAIDLELEFAAAFGQRAAVERLQGKTAAAEADEKQADALDPSWRKTKAQPRIQAGG